MQRFITHHRGNVSLVVALCLVPILLAVGGATDLMRTEATRTYLQDLTDAAALNAAVAGPGKNEGAAVDLSRRMVEQSGKASSIEGLAFNGRWISAVDYEVTATGAVPTLLLGAVPGAVDRFHMNIRSVARLYEAKLTYQKPKMTRLDPDAGDYNRIYAYCFMPEPTSVVDDDDDGRRKRGRGRDDDDDRGPRGRDDDDDESGGGAFDANGRSAFVAIADNGGTSYDYEMPDCPQDSFLSYRLHNVRNSRTTRRNWDKTGPGVYEHYTDTSISDGVEVHNGLTGVALVETVICPTRELCVEKPRGVLPSGPNRKPEQAVQRCEPGKFMYYGWEDRPPKAGQEATDDSDQDYNDLRLIVDCPVPVSTGERNVRLIR